MPDSETTVTVHAEVGSISIDTRAFWLDLLDRGVKTFLQNVLVFLGAGATLVSVAWPAALSAAGLATLVSVLLAFVASTQLTSGNFLIDLGDRVARTFAGSLVAAIPATGGFADVAWKDALTIAATAAVISALTSLASFNIGATKGLPSTAPVALPVVVDVEPETVTDTEYNAGTLGEAGGPVPYDDSGRHSADN
ncbi:holin [Rhodococcoides fascians]|uniref:holin n=1 Tax=Rhodococcoides fascians TaxID=1828 RepID=UPI00056146AA|nr:MULTISPECIES: holin [Rhodococcus]OZE98070.1 hypothetical protein CH301_17140 [Rhodococcus sp. 15-1189-1-1a]OZF12720.1 hypothetical protein CH299_17825 [Rhodococcus sp. 14-2686-1-2]